MSDLSTAIAITAKAFEGIYDKGGEPYILHCLAVMYGVAYTDDDEIMMAAVMHDLIEDTDYTTEDLYELGFSSSIVNMISRLTHMDGDSYDEYLDVIACNKGCIQIKLADLKHNTDITRMKGLREKDFKRLEKYHRAYKFLEECLENFGSGYAKEYDMSV